MSYLVKETRCRAKKPDGKRCKLHVQKGKYLCEHHETDLFSLFRDAESCVKIMTGRYPKQHHPACDRKGVNDCYCRDYSRGAQVIKTIKKAVEDSMNLSELYSRRKDLQMRIKVKKIRNYYNSITEDELWLPYKPGFRQFRFFVWDTKQQRVVVRVIKDNIRNKTVLLRWLRKLAPLHVYYTTSAWLNPQGIGPDPEGRKGRSKFKKKGWSMKMKNYHNTWLWQELYFDVDYCNADYNEGAATAAKLTRFMNRTWGYNDPMIVFSGGKGFHVIYTDEWLDTWREFMSDCTLIFDSAQKQEHSRDLKEQIVGRVRHAKILIDYDVTPDPRRIIRLPGTVHGKTLRLCKLISPGEIQRGKYIPDDPIG